MQQMWAGSTGARLSRQAFSFVLAALLGYFIVLQLTAPVQDGSPAASAFHSTSSASASGPASGVVIVPLASATLTPEATATLAPSPEPPSDTPTATAAVEAVVETTLEPPGSTPEPPTPTPEPPTATFEPPTSTPEPTATPSPAQGQAGPYPHGAVGYDISFPQCPDDFPLNSAYGIIGVTGGLAYTANPCFSAEFGWAQGLASQPAFYTNTSNSGPVNENWGLPGPLPCLAPEADDDLGCAYNFGWNGAAYSFSLALEVTPAAAAYVWWLDVETENSWNGTPEANTAAIRGFYDYFKAQGVAVIGIYSTGYQWNLITGGHSLPGAPNWVAGASDTDDLLRFCAASFSGGPVWLVQFQISPFHGNYACPL